MKILARLLSTLAWRNVWRNRRRSVIIVLAIGIGSWSMIAMTAFARGWLEQQVVDAIANLTGHIQLHAPGYLDDPVVDYSMEPPTAALRSVLDAAAVRAWATRVRVPAMVASERESRGAVLVGIDPERERGLSFIPNAVKQGRYLDSVDDNGLIMGRKLAERLETGLGKRVVIMSQDVSNEIADRGFRIVGIFEGSTQDPEERFVFAGRETLQAMLGMGSRVSEISLVTGDRDRLGAVTTRLRSAAPGLDVRTWTELEPLVVIIVRTFEVFMYIWFAVIFLIVAFGLVNTLLMAVYERTREFGLEQALGMRPGLIVMQILGESLVMLAFGLLLGNALAWFTLAALSDGIDLSRFAAGVELFGGSTMLYLYAKPADVVGANLTVLVLGILASMYPAWRAGRNVPVEALART